MEGCGPCLTSHGKAQRSAKWQGPARKEYAKEMEKKSKEKEGRVGWGDLAVLSPKVRGGGKPQQATGEEPEHTTNKFSPPPSKPSEPSKSREQTISDN